MQLLEMLIYRFKTLLLLHTVITTVELKYLFVFSAFNRKEVKNSSVDKNTFLSVLYIIRATTCMQLNMSPNLKKNTRTLRNSN